MAKRAHPFFGALLRTERVPRAFRATKLAGMRRRHASSWGDFQMTTRLLAAIGLCGALLAACSQETEDKADQAGDAATVAATQAGEVAQSAASDATTSAGTAAVKVGAAADAAGDKAKAAADRIERKADAAVDAASQQK